MTININSEEKNLLALLIKLKLLAISEDLPQYEILSNLLNKLQNEKN